MALSAAVLATAVGWDSARAAEPGTRDCARVLAPDLRQICQRGVLRVARYGGERPPFFSLREAGWVGFDVDLARDMAERLGVEYSEDASADSFDTVVDKVADGSADIALSKLSATLDRAMHVRFSRPYLTVYQALLVNRVSAPGGGDPFEELNVPGMEIGALAGTSYIGFVENSLSQSTARPYTDFEQMMNDVVAGTTDAGLMDSAQADSWRRANSEKLIHVRTTIDRSRRDPLAIAVGWENLHLLAWINLYLAKIEADGTAERLYRKWFAGRETLEPAAEKSQ